MKNAAANTAALAPTTLRGSCAKCDGTGRIRAFEHIVNGVCFHCRGTGKVEITVEQAQQSAEQEAARAVAKAENDRRAAWLATFDGVDPLKVVAAFRKLSEARLWAIRDWTAGTTADDLPGVRVAYWAASTVLGAWPTGRAYPESWVGALRSEA